MHVIRDLPPRPFWWALGLALLWAGIRPLGAQLPIARLTSIFPPGGKAGSTLEVSVNGSDLDDPSRLQFEHPGINASPVAGAGTRFQVNIASNVPPGFYDVRFVGRFGLSNPRRFVVGTAAESVIPSTNTTAATAADLLPNTVVNSRGSANAFSWFRFNARKGQRYFVECLGDGIDSRLEPILLISDSAGREHERARSGGLLDFTAPTDGPYLIRVADFLYRGGDDYPFRLALSTGPRVDYIFPPAGIRGTKTNFTLYGRNLPGAKPVKGLNLDGKPLEQLNVSIRLPGESKPLAGMPAVAGLELFEYRFKGANGWANPVTIALMDSPVLSEQEPNGSGQAKPITPPCTVAGQFYPAADVDAFTFEAKKGDVYWMEVVSQRLGLPTGTFLLVQRVVKNDQGEVKLTDVLEQYASDTSLGDREFNTVNRDPVGRFEAKEDGTYRVTLRDLFNPATAHPRNVYVLNLRRESPDFRLVAQAIAPKYKADAKNVEVGVPAIRRGETLPIRVIAFRRDGFNGEIELGLENAPPGLSFVKDRLAAGKSSDYFLLTATPDAPAFAGPVKLVGKAKVGEREVVRVACGGTIKFAVPNIDTQRPQSRATPDFSLAIVDKEMAPISITPTESRTFEVAGNAKLDVPLTVTRRGEFTATLKLKPLGPGAADGLKEFEVDAKTTNAVLKLDPAVLKLGPGSYVFAVQTITTGKYRNNPEAAAFAEAAAKEAEKLAGEAEAGAKAAAAELDKAAKALSESEGRVKSAVEKLAATKAALEKGPEDEKLKSDHSAAEKAHLEATTASRTVAEAKATAEKARTTAESRSNEAKAKKDEAAKRSKELTEKAKARDISYQVTSAPIYVKVLPAAVAEKKDKDKDKDKENDKAKATKQASTK